LLKHRPAPSATPAAHHAALTARDLRRNLMTQQDATALGVQWKTMDARIVDVKPVEGAMPQYKTPTTSRLMPAKQVSTIPNGPRLRRRICPCAAAADMSLSCGTGRT
jgi:hypothetical protein